MAITYGDATFTPMFDTKGDLVALAYFQQVTLGAAGDTNWYFPQATGQNISMLDAHLRDRKFKIRAVVVQPNVIAAPTSMRLTVVSDGGVQMWASNPVILTVANGMENFDNPDCPFLFKWSNYGAQSPIHVWISAPTANDSHTLFALFEVVK